MPFSLNFIRERIRILHAFHIASGARIAIPVPCTANLSSSFEYDRGETALAQSMQGIKSAETGSHNDRIKSHIVTLLCIRITRHHHLPFSLLSMRPRPAWKPGAKCGGRRFLGNCPLLQALDDLRRSSQAQLSQAMLSCQHAFRNIWPFPERSLSSGEPRSLTRWLNARSQMSA